MDPLVRGAEMDPDKNKNVMDTYNVAYPDPGSGAFFDPWIRDPEWVRFGSGINNPDHISDSLEIILLAHLKYLCRSVFQDGKNSDPEFGMDNFFIWEPDLLLAEL
jgi:hypothetical protein